MPPGIYKHYKGDLYRLLFLALESTNGRPREGLVVYISLKHGNINVRRREEFEEMVRWPDGVARPRFVPLPPRIEWPPELEEVVRRSIDDPGKKGGRR